MHLAERGGRFEWIVPLLAFLAVNAVLWTAAAADGFDYWSTATWIRWDSFHYLEMAAIGLTYEPCVLPELFDLTSLVAWVAEATGIPMDLPDRCGNAGWFPGYPGAIRILDWLAVDPSVAAVGMSIVSQFAVLALLWNWFLRSYERSGAYLALIAAAFFLGHVYLRAAFPIAPTLVFVLAHLRALSGQKWLAAGCFGALAALFYPTAFLLAPVALVWLYVHRGDEPGLPWVPAGIVTGLITLGYGGVLLAGRLETGNWLAFFEIQSRFDYGVHLPTVRLGRIVEALSDAGIGLAGLPWLHSLVAAGLMLVLIGTGALGWKEARPVDRWVVIYLGAFWIFPLMLNGDASLYRIESLLLPGVILLPRLRRPVQVAVTLGLVAMSYPMALLFYRNVLI